MNPNLAVVGRPKRGANKLKAAGKLQQRRSAYGNFAAHLPNGGTDQAPGQPPSAKEGEAGSGVGKNGRLTQVSHLSFHLVCPNQFNILVCSSMLYLGLGSDLSLCSRYKSGL